MKVFFDAEFTGLDKSAELLSIGLVSEDGQEFYAEVSDYDDAKVSKWVRENVIAHFTKSLVLTKKELKLELEKWLCRFDKVDVWADVGHYDWVLFCDVFGGAFSIPKHVRYICFDLATLFLARGIDPDVNREEFAGTKGKIAKHNALWDAKVAKACYEKLNENDAIYA